MTAEGMRKSELFWPHHSVSKAAWEEMVSATEAIGGHRTERDRETGAQRQRERRRARHWPRDIPVRSRWEEGDGEGGREREAEKG